MCCAHSHPSTGQSGRVLPVRGVDGDVGRGHGPALAAAARRVPLLRPQLHRLRQARGDGRGRRLHHAQGKQQTLAVIQITHNVHAVHVELVEI